MERHTLKATLTNQKKTLNVSLTKQTKTINGKLVTIISGYDGFSPIVTIEPIEGGHRIAIEDVNETHEFDVLDGRTEINDEVLERIINDYFERNPVEDIVARETIQNVSTDLSNLETRVNAVEVEVGNASILLGLI